MQLLGTPFLKWLPGVADDAANDREEKSAGGFPAQAPNASDLD